MQLFFQPHVQKTDHTIEFDKDESRHIAKVLRKEIGDLLQVTNGKGNIFETEITNNDFRKCSVKILKVSTEEEPAYYLHLAVAPTKMNDRYEWFLEKATEIGVHEITPVICDHGERKVVKLNRFEKVLQSAMKQSLQTRIPILNEPVLLKDFLNMEWEGEKFIAHCEDQENKKNFKAQVEKGKKMCVLIGPEGDFSSEEIVLALQKNWIPVSLGNTRLRTETAAIVACHTVALENE